MTQDKNRIEETLAHQEQQINDLSDMLIAQGRDIEKLQKQLQKLEGKLEQVTESDQPANQKPPHY
ncbi:MAG: SlyX family protein [Alphaproteobacteria bacterium]